MPKDKREHCAGCRDDFYNGNNDLGVKECWHLKSARLIRKKEVHVDQRPPWNQKAQKFLNCYRKPRHVYVGPDQTY